MLRASSERSSSIRCLIQKRKNMINSDDLIRNCNAKFSQGGSCSVQLLLARNMQKQHTKLQQGNTLIWLSSIDPHPLNMQSCANIYKNTHKTHYAVSSTLYTETHFQWESPCENVKQKNTHIAHFVHKHRSETATFHENPFANRPKFQSMKKPLSCTSKRVRDVILVLILAYYFWPALFGILGFFGDPHFAVVSPCKGSVVQICIISLNLSSYFSEVLLCTSIGFPAAIFIDIFFHILFEYRCVPKIWCPDKSSIL